MSVSVLSKRYAKAIFDLAVKGKAAEKIEGDLLSIKELINESEGFRRVVESPVVSNKDQASVLEAILKKLKVQDLTKKFVLVLIENGRLDVLSEVVDAYSEMLKEHKGEAVAEVITAVPLKAKQISEIEKFLSRYLGSKVKVNAVVQEEILGGLVVKIGSKMLDASVLGKLEKLKIISKNAIASC